MNNKTGQDISQMETGKAVFVKKKKKRTRGKMAVESGVCSVHTYEGVRKGKRIKRRMVTDLSELALGNKGDEYDDENNCRILSTETS
jgi:hypothetical protein